MAARDGHEELTPIPYRRIALGILVLILVIVAFAFAQELLAQSRARTKERLIRSLIAVGMSDADAVAALAEVDIIAFCNNYESGEGSHCWQRLISLRSNDGLMQIPRTIEYTATGGGAWTDFGAKFWIVIEIDESGAITSIK